MEGEPQGGVGGDKSNIKEYWGNYSGVLVINSGAVILL